MTVNWKLLVLVAHLVTMIGKYKNKDILADEPKWNYKNNFKKFFLDVFQIQKTVSYVNFFYRSGCGMHFVSIILRKTNLGKVSDVVSRWRRCDVPKLRWSVAWGHRGGVNLLIDRRHVLSFCHRRSLCRTFVVGPLHIIRSHPKHLRCSIFPL